MPPHKQTARLANQDLVEALKKRRADLIKLNVRELSIFGSHAKGDARKDSDVDVLVRFKGSATLDCYMNLKFFLEDLFGRKIDLVTHAALRPELRDRITREAVRVA